MEDPITEPDVQIKDTVEQNEILSLLMNKQTAEKRPIFKLNKIEKLVPLDKDADEQVEKRAVIVDKTDESRIDRSKILQELKAYQELGEIRTMNVEKEVDLEERKEPPAMSVQKSEEAKEEESGEQYRLVKRELDETGKERKPDKISLKPNTINEQTMEKLEREAVETKKRIATVSSLSQAVVDVPEDIYVNAPVHYLDNREMFVRSLNLKLKSEFKLADQSETEVVSCDVKSEDRFELLTHQKIVKYYLNIFTPYRGLLLYHGLGAGKTCASIAIAEGLKTYRKVLIMTPASLRMNYIEELKKCGDPLYKRDQHWEFISTLSQSEYLPLLKSEIGLTDEYIKKNKGGWLVNPKKPSNYQTLSTQEKMSLDKQINEMIGQKYDFINYNGINKRQYDSYSSEGKVNPFDNRIIIIDEAHNLVSRIVNKLKMGPAKRKTELAYKIYDDLMRAQNTKIVLLSGTPMINYPNEVAILFNILRGYIKTWSIPLVAKEGTKVDNAILNTILKTSDNANYINYDSNSKILEITRNPYGFINNYKSDKYMGVVLNERGEITDAEFIDNLRAILKPHKITFDKRKSSFKNNTALPDNSDEFKEKFFDFTNNKLKNSDILIRRILGLTSYYRSAQEQLLPRYDESKDLIIEEIEMSDHQFDQYNKARITERKQEQQNAKKRRAGGDVFQDIASTYRIFSRLFCNFVFPSNIERPMPTRDETIEDAVGKGINEVIIDNVKYEDIIEQSDSGIMKDDKEVLEDHKKGTVDTTYDQRIQTALTLLEKEGDAVFSQENLVKYSPKFLRMIQNITDESKQGKHLIYTQFRTLEGIGILKLILEYNGYVELRIKKDMTGNWVLDIPEAVQGRPMFALYTGTETAEMKEIYRNIFNSDWAYVPETLRAQLEKIQPENTMGQLVKVFMITASGAEGITLKNVRYVHITEPYWHPVRREQVIGRAVRICSHNTLPQELRTVNVHIYLMVFDEKKLSDTETGTIELKLKDRSKDGKHVFTTDQALHEISNIKQELSNQLLKAIKSSSIDCDFHKNKGVVCYKFSNPKPDNYIFVPKHEKENEDEARQLNEEVVAIKPTEFTMPDTGEKYFVDQNSKLIYDYKEFGDYQKANGAMAIPDPIGKLIIKKNETGKKVVTFEWY